MTRLRHLLRRRSARTESGLTDLVVFLLILPFIIYLFLLILNYYVLTTSLQSVPPVAKTAATITAASGSGDLVVPYVPQGQGPMSANEYLRTYTANVPFVDSVKSAECTIGGTGEALSISRCTVTFTAMYIGGVIFNNPVTRWFGQDQIVIGEDVATTGTNPNVQ